jgi:hypothetical protein
MKSTTMAFGLTFLVAGLAHADAETVHLTSGAVYSGELVEKIPGDHVTIKLATGEVKRFDWTDIAPKTPAQHLETQQPLAPITPEPQQQQTVTPLPPRPARVRFNSDVKGALLMRVDTVVTAGTIYPSDTESPVCYAPCSASADANARYYVRGAYITTSGRFAISEGESTLSVRAGNAGVSSAGGWLLGFGVMSAVIGAVTTPLAFAFDDAGAGWNGWHYFGVTSLIAGAGLILISLPFIVAGRTHVALGDMDVAHHRVQWAPNGFRF